MIDKSDFACPDAHLQELDKWTPTVSHVVSIGWRGAERHFAERFLTKVNGDARWLIVGRDESDGDQKVATLRAAVPGLRTSTAILRFRGNGFTEFLRTEALEEFLAT